MWQSQQSDYFQPRPSYARVTHKSIIPEESSEPSQREDDQKTVPVPEAPPKQNLNERRLIQQIMKTSLPYPYINKPSKRKRPKHGVQQSSTQKVPLNPEKKIIVSGKHQYQRPQQPNQLLSQSFHTAYNPTQQEESLFDKLLKLAPNGVEVRFQRVVDFEGQFEWCEGECNGNPMTYCRRVEADPRGRVYEGFYVQLN